MYSFILHLEVFLSIYDNILLFVNLYSIQRYLNFMENIILRYANFSSKLFLKCMRGLTCAFPITIVNYFCTISDIFSFFPISIRRSVKAKFLCSHFLSIFHFCNLNRKEKGSYRNLTLQRKCSLPLCP